MKNVTRLLLPVLVVSLSFAQTGAEKKKAAPKTAPAGNTHAMIYPDAIKWGPFPASLVEGAPPAEFANDSPAQCAILAGDPTKPGSNYIMRIKMSDCARVAPHWHPGDENITVLQGTLLLGVGQKFDKAALHELPAGSYALMPKRTAHFGSGKGETIVQVNGVGPFKVVWLNPAAAPPAKPAKSGN